MKAILTILKKDLTLGYPWVANPRGIAKDKKTRTSFDKNHIRNINLFKSFVIIFYL